MFCHSWLGFCAPGTRQAKPTITAGSVSGGGEERDDPDARRDREKFDGVGEMREARDIGDAMIGKDLVEVNRSIVVYSITIENRKSFTKAKPGEIRNPSRQCKSIRR